MISNSRRAGQDAGPMTFAEADPCERPESSVRGAFTVVFVPVSAPACPILLMPLRSNDEIFPDRLGGEALSDIGSNGKVRLRGGHDNER
jgi:hypothetical protein